MLQNVAGRLQTVQEMRTGEFAGLEKLRNNVPLLKESLAMLEQAAIEIAETGMSSVGVTDLDQIYFWSAEVAQELQYYQDYIALFDQADYQSNPMVGQNKPPAPAQSAYTSTEERHPFHFQQTLERLEFWNSPLRYLPTVCYYLRQQPIVRGQGWDEIKDELYADRVGEQFQVALITVELLSGTAKRASDVHDWILGKLAKLQTSSLATALIALLWATVTKREQRDHLIASMPKRFKDCSKVYEDLRNREYWD